MITDNTNRALQKVLITTILVISFGFSIYCYVHNRELADKYELQGNSINPPDRTSLVAFLALTGSQVQGYETIEIFDIRKGEVVKKVPSDRTIQKEVENYLKGITGIYVKFRPIPEKGYMIKVPLEPYIKVENQWLNSLVDQVILIFPEQGKPYLMVFDDENRGIFYTFKGSVEGLLKRLNFQYKP